MRLIFSTCWLPGTDSRRISNWAAYYSTLFPDADLRSFHDGPLPEDDIVPNHLHSLIVPVTPHLGRQTLQLFPGWKRGFAEGLRYGIDNGYDSIIHIESDLYIRKYYRERFLQYFAREGYFSGASRAERVMETSLQIINDIAVAKRLCSFFSKPETQFEARSAEWQIMSLIQPQYISKGERLEKNIPLLLNDFRYEYYAQCDFDKYRQHILRDKRATDVVLAPLFATLELGGKAGRRVRKLLHTRY